MDDEQEVPQEGQDDRLDQMFRKLEAIEKENRELKADVIRMTFTRHEPEEPEVVIPEMDLSGLPDMQEHPEAWQAAYTKRLAEHNQAILEANRASQTVQMSQQERAQQLISQFQEAHPELAKDMERVEFASSKAWKKGLEKGLDMNRYAYGKPEMFFEDVVNEYNRLFGGKPQNNVSEALTEPETTPEEDARAWGVFGGYVDSAPRKPTKADEQLGSVSKDIQEFQRKAGLSW